MRVLKSELATALEVAARFNQLPLVILNGGGKRPTAEEIFRNKPDFIPVCKYGRGMLVLRAEFGTNMKGRFLLRERM